MDKSLKRKRIWSCVVFYIMIGALFIYGTIGMNDLNFDKMVFNPLNKFAFTMACYGMLPRYTIQLFGYTMLMVAYRPLDEAFDVAESLFPFFKFFRENKFCHTVLAILYRVMFVAFIYGAFKGAEEAINFVTWNAFDMGIWNAIMDADKPEILANVVWLAVRAVLIAISYFVLKKLAKKHGKALELMAVAGLGMYYASGVIDMLKEHYHRIRFREMVAYSNGVCVEGNKVHSLHDAVLTRDMIAKTDFHWFTNWYNVGQDDGVIWHDPRSFPSGHTSAASFTMLLVPLFSRTRELSKYFVPASVIGIGYTMAMGLSRMMRGAHYMTDVTGAALIMFTIMILIVGILDIMQCQSDKRLKTHK